MAAVPSVNRRCRGPGAALLSACLYRSLTRRRAAWPPAHANAIARFLQTRLRSRQRPDGRAARGVAPRPSHPARGRCAQINWLRRRGEETTADARQRSPAATPMTWPPNARLAGTTSGLPTHQLIWADLRRGPSPRRPQGPGSHSGQGRSILNSFRNFRNELPRDQHPAGPPPNHEQPNPARLQQRRPDSRADGVRASQTGGRGGVTWSPAWWPRWWGT